MIYFSKVHVHIFVSNHELKIIYIYMKNSYRKDLPIAFAPFSSAFHFSATSASKKSSGLGALNKA